MIAPTTPMSTNFIIFNTRVTTRDEFIDIGFPQFDI